MKRAKEKLLKLLIVKNNSYKNMFKVEKSKLSLLRSKLIEQQQHLVLLENIVIKEKKEEELALAQKRAKEKKAEELALAQKRAKEKKALVQKHIEENEELEKLDLFQSDKIGEELALFNQKKKKKSSGFKDLNKWFKYSVGYSTMLKNLSTPNSGREALKGTITINPHSYYFLGATMSLDINSYHSPYYQPDFSYSFGYSDWHSDTINWNYSNYANNKFSPKEKESRFNFQSGTWEVSYSSKLEDISLSAKVKYKPSSNSKKILFKAKTIVFDDVMISAQLQHNLTNKQNKLTISGKTFIYDKFFVSGAIYEYYKPDTISSLDGEYAYSFGWSDSKPYHPSITYSNYYTPTRWDKDKGPKFNEGTLSIKFKLDF